MSSFFKQGGPTPYFTPPALLEEVQQWLDSNGHDAGLALRVIDLHARWFHNRKQSFSTRAIQRTYRCGRKAADVIVIAVMALAGLRKVEHAGSTGKVQGFHLERITSVDKSRSTQGQQTDNKRHTHVMQGASSGTQVRPQEQQVRPQEHQVRPQEHTNKEVNKEVNKETNKEHIQSSQQSCEPIVRRDKGALMIREGLRLYDAAQALYGGAQSDAIAKADLRKLYGGLTDQEIDFRVGIALGVASSRYWQKNEAPSPYDGGTQIWNAITGNWQELEFDQAPPLTSQQYFWSDEHATFVDEVGFDPLGQEVGKDASEALVDAFHVEPDLSVLPAPLPAKPFPKQQRSETHETDAERMNRLHREAQRQKAALLAR